MGNLSDRIRRFLTPPPDDLGQFLDKTEEGKVLRAEFFRTRAVFAVALATWNDSADVPPTRRALYQHLRAWKRILDVMHKPCEEDVYHSLLSNFLSFGYYEDTRGRQYVTLPDSPIVIQRRG